MVTPSPSKERHSDTLIQSVDASVSTGNQRLNPPQSGLSEDSRRRVQTALADVHAPSTRRVYAGHWRKFDAFCSLRNYRSLPASADVVCEYLHTLESTIIVRRGVEQVGYSISHIGQALAAIQYVHRAAVAAPLPVEDGPTELPLWSHPRPRDFLRSARNRNAREDRVTETAEAPLLLNQLQTMIDDMHSSANTWTKRLHARRDSALLLIGWIGACRRSEVVGLRVDKIKGGHKGKWTVTVARSKTDQAGRGQVKALPRSDTQRMCPQCAYIRWMECVTTYDTLGRVGLIRLLSTDPGASSNHVCRVMPDYPKPRSPVFRSIIRNQLVNEAMCDKTMHNIVRRRLEASFPDIDSSAYGAHSLRAGFVSESLNRGKSYHEIMRQTGHQSVSSLRKYAREVSIYDNNAATGLGL